MINCPYFDEGCCLKGISGSLCDVSDCCFYDLENEDIDNTI